MSNKGSIRLFNFGYVMDIRSIAVNFRSEDECS